MLCVRALVCARGATAQSIVRLAASCAGSAIDRYAARTRPRALVRAQGQTCITWLLGRGAGAWRRFRSVTLPMLSPVILFNLIVSVIGSFQVFTQAFVMTGGEPGDLTRFYVLYLFNLGFESYEMGYASAMAWILLLVVPAMTAILMRGSRGLVHYEGLKA